MAYKAQTQNASTVALNRASAATIAFVFGMFLVWGVGFAHPMTIHNAAHDGRHAFAFPCH